MATAPNLSDQAVQAHMRSVIQRVATGPEYSKDISFDEARDTMRAILKDQADPVQAGVFLIALRMKRETDAENGGILQAILESTDQVVADVDEVLDIAEPYDGYMRGLPIMPFLPAVLAACGLPTFSHGLEEVGPKFGSTHRKILRAAGVNVNLSSTQAAAALAQEGLAWAYVDRSKSCKPLHDLVPLRQRIVKRPVITTVEVLTRPIQGRNKTHLMTGYVHKPYPPVYERLAKQAGYDSAVIVRGVEGGVAPSLNKPSRYFAYLGIDGDLDQVEITPDQLGIEQKSRCVEIPESLTNKNDPDATVDVEALSQAAAESGLQALQGKQSPARDSLIYAGAIMLSHTGRANSLNNGAEMVEQVIDSGLALRHFEAAVQK